VSSQEDWLAALSGQCRPRKLLTVSYLSLTDSLKQLTLDSDVNAQLSYLAYEQTLRNYLIMWEREVPSGRKWGPTWGSVVRTRKS